MAGLTSTGIGSGLDINGLVSQLVAAEKANPQKQITRAQTATVTTISALATLKGAMATFNTSLDPLKSIDIFASRTATSSDQEFFSASATKGAASGVYDVQVERLASAHQISSNGFASGQSHVVGTGTLSISVGAKSFSVEVGSNGNTLANIRDAINQSRDNAGALTATIVNAADGAHLVLSSAAMGAANAITVSQSGGDGGLAALEYNPQLTTNYRQLRAAADAEAYIAGERQTSTTNVFLDAVDGVNITLLKADPGEVKTVTIANDTASTTTKVKAFVDQFNALSKQMTSLRNYDAATKKGGPLLGDAMLRAIESEMRTKLVDPVAGATGPYQTLASVGITTQKDGTLKLDTEKLTAAMSADFDGVARLFGSEGGVAARMSAALTPRLATDSELDLRTKSLNTKSLAIQKQQEQLEARMLKIEARYRAQFNSLDSLLSKLGSTSNYLSQQLSAIGNIGKS
jgi:flagellar hook-associated protein 2